MKSAIITFCPTGMLMKKSDTPYVPVHPAEIIEDVRAAVKIGISSVHLHARNIDESPAWEKEFFEQVILGIREFAPDLVVSVTTSGRTYNEFSKRSDVLDLSGLAKPDMASLTLSSLTFNKTASINDPDMIKQLAIKMLEKGIKPELEVFDVGMVNYAKYLIRKGILKPPYFFSVIMGNIACAQANLLHAGVLINDIPEESEIIIGGIGNAQLPINAMAMSMGYGARIGLEDNIWFDEERTALATNAQYLQRVHTVMDAVGRKLCTPTELRSMIGLKAGNGEYGV